MKYGDNRNTTTVTGISFAGLLTIVFITLKLIGVIDWSWVWVLSPLWINLALFLIILAVMGVMILVTAMKDNSLDDEL